MALSKSVPPPATKDADGYLESHYLVDEILPTQEVHLIGGPSGAGKTTWLLLMLQQFAKGEAILGHASHPVPFVYCATERSEKSVHRTLKRLGILPSEIPLVSLQDVWKADEEQPSIQRLLKIVKERYPKTRLIVIEAIAFFIPKGRTNDYSAVGSFIRTLTGLAQEHDVSFLVVHHTSKTREGEKFANPRERLLGSVALAATIETILSLDFYDPANPNDPYRRMDVMPRNAKNSIITFKMDERGRPQQVSHLDVVKNNSPKRGRPQADRVNAAVMTFLSVMENSQRTTFSTEEIEKALGEDGSKRTLYNRLKDLTNLGILERSERGLYKIVDNSTALNRAFNFA